MSMRLATFKKLVALGKYAECGCGGKTKTWKSGGPACPRCRRLERQREEAEARAERPWFPVEHSVHLTDELSPAIVGA